MPHRCLVARDLRPCEGHTPLSLHCGPSEVELHALAVLSLPAGFPSSLPSLVSFLLRLLSKSPGRSKSVTTATRRRARCHNRKRSGEHIETFRFAERWVPSDLRTHGTGYVNGSKHQGDFAWPWSRPEVRYVTARAPPGRPAGASQEGRGLPCLSPARKRQKYFHVAPSWSLCFDHERASVYRNYPNPLSPLSRTGC